MQEMIGYYRELVALCIILWVVLWEKGPSDENYVCVHLTLMTICINNFWVQYQIFYSTL